MTMNLAIILKAFDAYRGQLLRHLDTVSDEQATHVPSHFNNHILWNAGHIFTVLERTLFSTTGSTNTLPANYSALFGPGTKPADWSGDVPSLQTIISDLKDQSERVKEQFTGHLDDPLLKPLTLGSGASFEAVGEVLSYMTSHEALHTGYISALKRVLQG